MSGWDEVRWESWGENDNLSRMRIYRQKPVFLLADFRLYSLYFHFWGVLTGRNFAFQTPKKQIEFRIQWANSEIQFLRIFDILRIFLFFAFLRIIEDWVFEICSWSILWELLAVEGMDLLDFFVFIFYRRFRLQATFLSTFIWHIY